MTTPDARPAAVSVVDTDTEFGAHAAERLERETVAWLTTVGPSGTPQPNPVWFLWNGSEILLFSEPNQPKLRNIARNPRVSLNLNSTASGGEVLVLTGAARIDPTDPNPDEIARYTAKYTEGLADLKMTAEQFYATYSQAVRITPDRLRGF
ncbi:TIGR03667 family PPOX class F420-dependent oxidoreductase [Nocardia uniformis]|uniref:TIGR03667 family PPOX class F420-dependent oxidoreductase n=1 Tax=Nocardia uniformis TaxID=53432 RepID=A0A849BZ34_9NOCA|nr:TIGR03667 family PPOX class F420-dependent oxidoreductase [Nocardia uniformis]NNH71813.1 TIGR03667 family PPOX class F420-dependent oxidoreductase [Nocardia uniformis]